VTTTDIDPVVATVVVAVPPEEAWAVFTDRIGEWWPVLDGHSVGGERVADVRLEPGVGGRLYERWQDGTEHEWGGVTAWAPAQRLELWWRPDPGATYDPTTVEVTFRASGTGTEVRLVHTGWERLADGGERRTSYQDGWPHVLAPFAVRAGT
jgi:uncharacterized protein YndB with AHSA1/START domain